MDEATFLYQDLRSATVDPQPRRDAAANPHQTRAAAADTVTPVAVSAPISIQTGQLSAGGQQ